MGTTGRSIGGRVFTRIRRGAGWLMRRGAWLLRKLWKRLLPTPAPIEEELEETTGRRLLAEDPITRLRRIRWRAQAAVRRGAEDAMTRLLAHTRRAPRRLPRGVDPLPGLGAAGVIGGVWGDEDAAETVRQRAAIVRRLHDRLSVGSARDVEPAVALVDELLDLAIRRPSELVGLALNAETTHVHTGASGAAEHSYAVATMATAIAARLGWSEDHVRDAAMAGLLADAGMQLVAGQPGMEPRALDDVEVNKLHRHPMYSLAMAAAARGDTDEHHAITDAVLLGLLEHHEREDGSGYPRALRGESLHDVSRVLAVADCFCAALGDRPFRGPLSPHAALREVLNQAHAGRLWHDAASSLMSVTGVFPKGTSVVLSDGSSGVSLGIADPARPDRPVVELRKRGVVLGVLDLAESDTRVLSVAAALEEPAGEMRKAA